MKKAGISINMSIWVSGDTHGDFTRFSTDNFPQGKNLTKEDYVVILGDCGLIWSQQEDNREKYWKKWLDDKPWTTLFIPGNHCNFDRLESDEFKTIDWNGGKVKVISSSILYLPVGEIFDICGCRILAMGKNYSHDISDGILEIGDPRIKIWQKDYSKLFRVNHLSWWKQEVPNDLERNNAICNLSLVNNKVDFILTHALPSSDIYLIDKFLAQPNEFEVWLEENIRAKVDYVGWISGHYHMDKAASYKDLCIYERILQIL